MLHLLLDWEYPHWMMMAGAILVAVGFIGLAFHRNRNGPVNESSRARESTPTERLKAMRESASASAGEQRKGEGEMIPPGQRRADTSGQSTRSLAADKLLQALNASPHRRLCREPRSRPDRCLFAVHTWHETDMPKDLGDVRCWVNSGKHMLAWSFSGFDPVQTFDC